MNSRVLVLLNMIIVSMFFFSSCGFNHCIEGDSQLKTSNRITDTFNSVRSQGSWNIDMKNDSIYHVEVIGESNLLPYISTEVQNNELIIREFRNTCLRENTPIRLIVYGPEIKTIKIEGSGNVNFDTLKSSSIILQISGSGNMFGYVNTLNLSANISGSGDYTLYGKTTNTSLTIDGSGNFYAFGLTSANTSIDILGSGDVKTLTNTKLDISISGSGNVYYKGNPQISSHITGSGKIVNSN